MLNPDLVRRIVDSIHSVTSLPVTIKCRIGVDGCIIFAMITVDMDSYHDLLNFITVVSGTHPSADSKLVADSSPSVSHFIVHARKCWTKGVNTRENRRIPPLRYEWVFQLLDDFPSIDFTLNGGVNSFTDMRELLQRES